MKLDLKKYFKFKIFSEDELAKPVSIMFIASFLGGAFNYIYQVYMGRALGPEGYSVFGSLFAITYIMFILAGTIRTSSARFVSKFKGKDENIKINFFLFGMVKRLTLFGFIILLFFILMGQSIASFLKVDSVTPIYIVGSFFFFTLLLPLNMGILQGLQRFFSLGFYRVLNFSSKFVIGVILVSIGYGVNGALGAITISVVISLIASFYSIKPYITEIKTIKKPSFNYFDLYKFSIPSMLTMFVFAVPANVDVVIAKHFFPAEQVGYYTAASVLGKVVLFIPEAIAMVMYPKVSEASALKRDSTNLLYKSLIYTGVLSGIVTLSYWLFPSLVIKIPFGIAFLDAIPFVRYYGLAMFLFSLSIVVMRYCLAMHDLKFILIYTSFIIAEIILLWHIHETLLQMIIILLLTGIALFIISIFYIKIRVRLHPVIE